MTVFKFIYLVLLLYFPIEAREIGRVSPKDSLVVSLNETLEAIDRLLSFFEENAAMANLDGIYGLRVMEGALKKALTENDNSFWKATTETRYLHLQLLDFNKRAGSVCNRAQASIKEQETFYYNRFKHVVDKPWSFFSDFGKQKLPSPLSSSSKKKEARHRWDEKLSDRCMSEVLGSNPDHKKCLFSQECVKGITDMQQTEYGPTHQILFLTLALMNNCEPNYSKLLQDHIGLDVGGLILNRCVRIMGEMSELEERGVQEDQQDLYLEQAFVCAMHGFEEFLSLKRLKTILSWQLYPGCFGNLSHIDEYNEDTNGTSDHRGPPGDKRSRRGNPESFRSMRRLLVDKTLEYGCSSHESGVAAGLLGLYTRWQLTQLKTSLRTPNTAENHMIINPRGHLTGKTTEDRRGVGAEDKGKEVYIQAILVSFVTTILTMFVVMLFYKLCSYACKSRVKNPYKKLAASIDDKYVM